MEVSNAQEHKEELQSLISPQQHESSSLASTLSIDSPNPQALSRSIPLHAYLVLPFSILAISSAGTAFNLMQPVPPCTLAAWRLQATSVLLMVLAVVQWRNLDTEIKQRSATAQTVGLLALSGLCLALHFGFWVLSLSLTTLTHSLLFVTSTPLWVACWSLIMRRPLSRLEIFGLLLGATGAVIVSVSTGSIVGAAGSSHTPSFAGDMAALVAAIVMVGYLEVGSRLRAWMPLFVYAFPITALAALLLSVVALMVDSGSKVPHASLFGYTESLFLFGVVSYLALGPGLVGHCGFNHLLKYMSTLAVSLSFQLEPLIGSLIGWTFGVLSAPSALTIIGGFVMIGGTATVIWGGEKALCSTAKSAQETTQISNDRKASSRGKSDDL